MQQGRVQGEGTLENPPFVIDPRYRKLICFNCGEPGHFVGNCSKPKICFICAVPGHHMNDCSAWKSDHPSAEYMGSANLGLGFYHLEAPDAESTRWLNMVNCDIVKVKSGAITSAELEKELANIYCKEWPWQIRELEPNQFLVRFPPHRKVADIKNYPSFNLRKGGVQVEVLEWMGDLTPYSVLQELWVQMTGIPPKYCHWRVFAQIASSFGLLMEVDWSSIFKSFYEMVRVKISCKDGSKIPQDRLFEMKQDIFVVSFRVEGRTEEKLKGKGTDDGGDDNNMDNDDEADDLGDDEDGVEKPVTTKFQVDKSLKTPTNKIGPSNGQKTISGTNFEDGYNQDSILLSMMGGLDSKLVTANYDRKGQSSVCIDASKTCVSEILAAVDSEKGNYVLSDDTEGTSMVLKNQEKEKQQDVTISDLISGKLGVTHNDMEDRIVRQMKGSDLESIATNEMNVLKPVEDVVYIEEITPVQNSDVQPQQHSAECQFVKKKSLMVEEESRHSRWEEFRRIASRDMATEECSNLLKKMELEESDNEEELNSEDDMMSMEKAGLVPSMVAESFEPGEDGVKKTQKRKTGWGPIQRIPRPRRGVDDGRTMLQKAQDLKKMKNLEKRTNYSSSFSFKSNSSLQNKAYSVGIELGKSDLVINNTIDGLKQKELDNLKTFEESNPEVNLPGDLNIEIDVEEFPPLSSSISSPAKGNIDISDRSWVQIVSKDKEENNLENFNNDRCFLE